MARGPAADRFLIAPPLPDRIARRIDVGDCWLWRGGVTSFGYGQVMFKRRRLVVHRFVYELLVGPVSEGLELDHLCRVPSCCNPDHLEPVTHSENILRAVRRTHCVHGHQYAPENTCNGADGRRRCRACARRRRDAQRTVAS